jgi:hypothetical protein
MMPTPAEGGKRRQSQLAQEGGAGPFISLVNPHGQMDGGSGELRTLVALGLVGVVARATCGSFVAAISEGKRQDASDAFIALT